MGADGIRRENKDRQWIIGSVVALVYGLLFINYFDLMPHPYLHGYQLWLIALYFAPAVLLAGVWFRNGPLVVVMGLLASLMNDLFYGPMGLVYHVIRSKNVIDHPVSFLQHYYIKQLGFEGGAHDFIYQAYFFNVPVTSEIMGVSILARFAIIVVLYLHYAGSAAR